MWFSRQRAQETDLEQIKNQEASLLKHKRTSSTQFSNSSISNVTPNQILRKKYQNATDHYLAFDIIAMATLRRGSKALTEWQEVQLSIPGEYDYFNGYCTANKYSHHLGIALKYHQFNIDKPAFYRLDEIADIHELNLVRNKMLQKRAIEAALKNITKEQIDACFVNLDEYMSIKAIITEDPNESINDKVIELLPVYTVYRAVQIQPALVRIIERPNPTPPLEIYSLIECYFCYDKEKLINGKDLSIGSIEQDSSFTCPSCFSIESNKENQQSIEPVTVLLQHTIIKENSDAEFFSSIPPTNPLILEKYVEIFYYSPSVVEFSLNSSHYLLKNRVSISQRKEESPTRKIRESNFTTRRIDLGSKLISKKREAYPSKLNLNPSDHQEGLTINHYTSSRIKVDISKSKLFEKRNLGLVSIEVERPSFAAIKKTIKEKCLESPTLSPTQSKSKMSSFVIKLGSRTPKTQDRPPTSLDFHKAVQTRPFVARSIESRSPTTYKVSRPKVALESRPDSEMVKAEEASRSRNIRLVTSHTKNRRSIHEDSQNRSKASVGFEDPLPLKGVGALGNDWKKGILSNMMKNKAGIFSMYQQPRKIEPPGLPQVVSTKIPGLGRYKHILRTLAKD